MNTEKSYDIVLSITDKQMKKTFDETASVSGDTEEEARVMAIFLAQEIWPAGKYEIKVKSCKIRRP